MTRVAFHAELKKLEAEVLTLGDMVDKAVRGSIDALEKRDIEASKAIIRNDAEINKKRYEIEDACLLLIATQQPMAVDLRSIAAMLSIVTELERIADHAEGTAKISVMIGDKPLIKPLDKDDEVDALYEEEYRDLIHMMIKNPDLIEEATYLIWVGHNLERIADRVTNIAERVVFMVTGKMEEINVSRY